MADNFYLSHHGSRPVIHGSPPCMDNDLVSSILLFCLSYNRLHQKIATFHVFHPTIYTNIFTAFVFVSHRLHTPKFYRFLLCQVQPSQENKNPVSSNDSVPSKKNISAVMELSTLFLHLYYTYAFEIYQILRFYVLLMLKKHFENSINFVVAKLNGCPRFHAKTLVVQSSGYNGR